MKVWISFVEDHETGKTSVGGVFAKEDKAAAHDDYDTYHVGYDVIDWDAAAEKPATVHSGSDEEFRPASLQPIVSQPSLTAAMTRAWLAWLAYNQPDTKVSGDEFFEGKLVRSGETAAEAWSRLQSSESEREFLKLQQLVPAVPQR